MKCDSQTLSIYNIYRWEIVGQQYQRKVRVKMGVDLVSKGVIFKALRNDWKISLQIINFWNCSSVNLENLNWDFFLNWRSKAMMETEKVLVENALLKKKKKQRMKFSWGWKKCPNIWRSSSAMGWMKTMKTSFQIPNNFVNRVSLLKMCLKINFLKFKIHKTILRMASDVWKFLDQTKIQQN